MKHTINKIISLMLFVIVPLTGSALSASPKDTGTKYLTIVSTEVEGLEFIQKYNSLKQTFPQLEIVSSRHCTNLKPGLILLTSAIDADKPSSDSHLALARKQVPDSYQRKCIIEPTSTLAYDQPFIDKSILKLPADTINWAFEDMASSVHPVDEHYAVLVKKRFSGDSNDELEGRRSEIHLINSIRYKTWLIGNCLDFNHASIKDKKLVYQCVTGMAANEYIHTSYLYDIAGSKTILDEAYCQQPVIRGSKVLCKKESVNEFGELKLVEKMIDINK